MTDSNKCVLSQGALTFYRDSTQHGGIKFLGTNTLQFSDNAGGTTAKVILANIATPTDDAHVATKGYVDGVAQGLNAKGAVDAATTAQIVASAATSLTITVISSIVNGQGFDASTDSFTIDGIPLAQGARLLVKTGVNVSDAGASNVHNGIYTVGALDGATLTLTRATDANTAGEIFRGAYCVALAGTTNASTGWVSNTSTVGTLGTDAITFVQFSALGGGFTTAGAGLTAAGSTINLDTSDLDAITTLQTSSTFPVYDTSTQSKITFANLRDEIFADVSGNATIAPGGALTIQNNAVTNAMLAGSIANDKLANSTISGVALGSTLYALTAANSGGIRAGIDGFTVTSGVAAASTTGSTIYFATVGTLIFTSAVSSTSNDVVTLVNSTAGSAVTATISYVVFVYRNTAGAWSKTDAVVISAVSGFDITIPDDGILAGTVNLWAAFVFSATPTVTTDGATVNTTSALNTNQQVVVQGQNTATANATVLNLQLQGSGIKGMGGGGATLVATVQALTYSGYTGTQTQELQLDFSSLQPGTLAQAADSIAFLDATDSSTKKVTVADFVSAIAGSGLTASSGQLTASVNINGLTPQSAVVGGDEFIFYDQNLTGNRKITWSEMLTKLAGSGLSVSSDQLTASGGGSLDISVLGTAAVADGDLLVFADVDNSNTNKKLTVGDLDTYLSGTTKTLTNKTLTAPTLTTPKFANSGYIADSAGNEHLVFVETAAAVNHFQMTNAATGSGPILAAVGSDTNVSLDLKPQGTGVIKVGTGAASGILQSNGDFDLILRTGNSTTGTITITDGADGNIALAPDGSGLIVASSHLQMAASKNIELVSGQYIRTGGNAMLLQCNNAGIVVDGSVTTTSDARLKQNFSRCGGVDVVKRLTGWQWDWRSNGLTSSGVIAQEVRDVLPYAVQENENGLSVNYNALHGVLIEAIKDLANDVEAMRAERRGGRAEKDTDAAPQRYNLRPR